MSTLAPTSKRRMLVVVLVGACALLLTVGVITASIVNAVTVNEIREAQITNTERAKNTADVVEFILGCTDPDGECYKDGQRRTAEAVGSITDVSARAAAYAAACADERGRQTQDQIFRCVMDRLAKDGLAN